MTVPLSERRVVFFLPGRFAPGARVRGFAVAQALNEAGVRCETRACHPSVYGDTNLPLPWRRFRPLFYPAALASRLGQLGGLRAVDVIYIYRPMFEWPFTWLERLVARGRRTVFDFDDAIYLNRFGRSKIRALIDLVEQVVVGNHTLAAFADAPGKTTVIPTVIDITRFTPQPLRATRGADVVVGWTGLHSNYRQLAVAKEGIARALRRTGARFLIISDRPPPPELAELKAEFVTWEAATEVEDLARIDIGVMPLPDEPYARGKCAFKLLQYMALARPGVASPIGASNDVVTPGVDGYLAGEQEAWEESLVALIEDPELRARVGQAGRARVESAYSLPAVLPRYLQVLDRLGLSAAT